MSWRFKIISVGWHCADYLVQTLQSIESQVDLDYDVMVIDDATTEDPRQCELIRSWCGDRTNWHFRLNPEHKWALRNQVEAIDFLDPDDEDVIVFLDLDGDRLAHPEVLSFLRTTYDRDQCFMTYGNYLPVPDMGTSPQCDPFPVHVVQTNTFRQEILHGFCHFNHLRTMKGFIFKSIPREYFIFQGTDRWYEGGTDYAFMVPALELSGANYRFIPETLCLYNHANPRADNIDKPGKSTASALDSLYREPLQPLSDRNPRPVPMPERIEPLYMTAEARRRLLREYGQRWCLHFFIETGTSDAATPLFLQQHFSQLHTIEIHEPFYQAARAVFPATGNVEPWFGDSAQVLPQVLAVTQGPALIWLDGHHSGPGTGRGQKDTPVVEELAAIWADGRPHVIMIDDARIFGEGPEHDLEPHYADYPTLTWVREEAERHSYDYELADDVIRLTPKDVHA